jgi:hypothetical protein
MKMEQSVPKRRHIKFRRREITQKKAYNIPPVSYASALFLYKYSQYIFFPLVEWLSFTHITDSKKKNPKI